MKRVAAALLLSVALFGSPQLRAEVSYSGNAAATMMSAMWDFMEWFLGQRNNSWRSPYTLGSPYTLYARSLGLPRSANSNPYRNRDYWDDPNNPWVDMQSLDGTWLAQSGEYWYVRGNRFILVNRNEEKTPGEFIVEGDFILTRLPWGEVEFEYRQMDDALMLRDVSGRIMLLRRIEAGGWNW